MWPETAPLHSVWPGKPSGWPPVFHTLSFRCFIKIRVVFQVSLLATLKQCHCWTLVLYNQAIFLQSDVQECAGDMWAKLVGGLSISDLHLQTQCWIIPVCQKGSSNTAHQRWLWLWTFLQYDGVSESPVIPKPDTFLLPCNKFFGRSRIFQTKRCPALTAPRTAWWLYVYLTIESLQKKTFTLLDKIVHEIVVYKRIPSAPSWQA